MNVKTEINGTSVTAFLSGEIDHHNAPQIREAIDECVAFRQPNRLILDFGDVTFMDSSGIGLVMGRYRLIEGKTAHFISSICPSTHTGLCSLQDLKK